MSRLLVIVRGRHVKDMKDVPISALSAKLWSEYQHLRLASPALPTFKPAEIRARDLLGLRDHVPHALHTSTSVGGGDEDSVGWR